MQQPQKRKKMVSKKLLKDYQFQGIHNYFGYIVDSHINGQFKQRDELISKLSKEQKKDFSMFMFNDEELIDNKTKEEIFKALI